MKKDDFDGHVWQEDLKIAITSIEVGEDKALFYVLQSR